MNITIIAPRQTIFFGHLCWPTDVSAINTLGVGFPSRWMAQHGHILYSVASWRQGTCGKNRRGRRVPGSDSCKLIIFLGMLLIRMSLFISWTPLIHPRNLYIHSLIHYVLQRLSPVIHVYMFGLELHPAGFHLSLSMLSALDVSEGSCNSHTERKDKVALILITAVCILHFNHSHTSAQMLSRKGDWHGVLLHIASGNP